MKKILASLILFVFTANLAMAQTVFYEDFTFYGELVTDIRINKVEPGAAHSGRFSFFSSHKIPIILNGEAFYKEIDGKPSIVLGLDKLSIGAGRHIPVQTQITALNGKKLTSAAFVKPNRYVQSVKRVNNYSKEVLMFPINRYKYNPTMHKPTKNTFIMLLEPVYAVMSVGLYAISPFSSVLVLDNISPDIKQGTVVEFEFLQEISKSEIQKAMQLEDL